MQILEQSSFRFVMFNERVRIHVSNLPNEFCWWCVQRAGNRRASRPTEVHSAGLWNSMALTFLVLAQPRARALVGRVACAADGARTAGLIATASHGRPSRLHRHRQERRRRKERERERAERSETADRSQSGSNVDTLSECRIVF